MLQLWWLRPLQCPVQAPKSPATIPWCQKPKVQWQITQKKYQMKLQPDDRCRSSWPPGRWPHHSPSHSTSQSHSAYQSNKSPRYSNRWHTPFQYNHDIIKVIPAPPHTDSVKTSAYPKESSLLMEQASDGQVSFYTSLMLPTKNGTKSMMMKTDPGAQVNTIHLSRYQRLFPHEISKPSYPKPGTLIPTSHSWISHDSKPQSFLGHFITKVNHATLPRSYPTHFYVFEDAPSPQTQLSYTTSEFLGILEFKVPSVTAQLYIDALTVPMSPNPGGLMKTHKSVTFWDP